MKDSAINSTKTNTLGDYISPCPNKAECGSCPLSHMPYNKQIEHKQNQIIKDFANAGINIQKRFEFIKSPKSSHYRNKMDYAISFIGHIGLRARKKWWKILDGHTCFIAHENIEKAFFIVRNWVKSTQLSYFDRKKHTGLLRYAIIRYTTTNELMVSILLSSLNFDSKFKEKHIKNELKDLANMLSDEFKNITVVWLENSTITDVSFGRVKQVITGKGYINEHVNNIVYRITPNSFFQNNLYLTPQLQQHVVDNVLKTGVEYKYIFDLYAGSGFFSIPIAKKIKYKKSGQYINIVTIEENKEAVEIGKVNAKLNKVDNITLIANKTEKVLQKYEAELIQSIVVLDPPRSGLHNNVISMLLKTVPEKIIYVSCKYQRFLQEFTKLGLNSKYSIEHVTVFDMFPQTEHVETVILLKKK